MGTLASRRDRGLPVRRAIPVLATVAGALMTMACGTTASDAAGQVAACSAQGSERLSPPIDAAAACARFSAALDAALAQAGASAHARDGMAVRLAFRAPGIATALVSIAQPGAPAREFDANLAVSDRPLAPQDIEHLATDVARRLLDLHD